MKFYKKAAAVLTAAVIAILPLSFAEVTATESSVRVQASEPAMDSNEYYLIYTADELYWVAEKYTRGEAQKMNVKLMNDIVVNPGTMTASSTGAREWIPFGGTGRYKTEDTYNFHGVIDGQGHTISGLYCTSASTAGLVAFNYGTIKNLGIINSYFSAPISEDWDDGYAGTIAGINKSGGVITDCYSLNCTVKSDYMSGGIAAKPSDGCVIRNCYSSNTVTSSQTSVSGRKKWADAIGCKLKSTAATIENCYYDSAKTISYAGALAFTAAQAKSGELAYRLNANGSASNWFQNIDNGLPVDAFPVLDTTHGVVLKSGTSYTNGGTKATTTEKTTETTTKETTTRTTTQTTTQTTTEKTTETTTQTTTEKTQADPDLKDGFIYGGACAEKTLSAADAAMILQKVLDPGTIMPIEKETPNYFKYIDVDADNQLTASDALYVMQKVLDEKCKFPAELSAK